MQKCKFLQKEIEYLNFHISDKGIYLTRNKIEGLLQMSLPKIRKELKQFLRMFNHCKRLCHTSNLNLEILPDLTSLDRAFR